MATHKSALKRAKQNKVRRLRNLRHKTRSKTLIKEVRTAVASDNPEQAKETLKNAVSTLQKTASKGVIHRNKASRTISRLARQVNQLSSEK